MESVTTVPRCFCDVSSNKLVKVLGRVSFCLACWSCRDGRGCGSRGRLSGGSDGTVSHRGRVGVQNRDIHVDIAFFLINDEAVKAFSFGMIIITEIYQRLRGGFKALGKYNLARIMYIEVDNVTYSLKNS